MAPSSTFPCSLGLTRRRYQDKLPAFKLLDLLWQFEYFEATLPRNHIFSLLGIASDGDSEDFVIDYKLPLEEIVWNYAVAFIQQGKVGDLIHYANPDSNPSWLPSWIPNWTNSITKHAVFTDHFQTRAASSTTMEVEISKDSHELVMMGFVVDDIARVGCDAGVPISYT
jgi:hypothetical protein